MTAAKAATLRRVPPLPRLAVLGAVLLCGCFGPPGPRSSPPGQTSAPSVGQSPTEPPTTLLAAHAQPPGAVDRDYAMPVAAVVYLVFSRSIDPMSLASHRFVLALPSGQRISPVGAFLGPAQERDEHRTVELLIADPRKDQSKPIEPISVTVTGLVHDVDGRELEGLSIDVAPPARPVFAVQAVAMATTTTCRGYDHAVRVYWSAPVRRAEAGPAPQISLLEGVQVAPQGVDDVDEPGDDNVIDYCLRGPGNLRWIDVPAGAVVDLRGAPAAKAGLVIQSHGPPGLGPQHVAAPVASPAS